MFIVTPHDDPTKFRFHHNRRQATSTSSLLAEFKRLSLNTLKTRAQVIVDVISNKKGVSLFTFNVQSLKNHYADLDDAVFLKSNILLLTETWLANGQQCNIPHFNCIVQFKRDTVRAGGVAIYQNMSDITKIVTPNMEMISKNIQDFSVRHTIVADLCAAQSVMENGITVVMAVIYVSPNQKIVDIQEFIHRVLLEYTEEGSRLLRRYSKNLYEIPLILAGDFNINFSDKKSKPLIQFLLEEFDLKINNDPTMSTTRFNTTIDAVFSRYLDKIESQMFVSYFSYHKPIVTMIE